MPSITIREHDLTSTGTLEVTSNTVYIPGYANMGPINTPILCESLQTFQSIFGSEPYRFREAQNWPAGSHGFSINAVNSTMGKFYEANEYEKSYIMAVELLKSGMTVLYERIFNDEGSVTIEGGTFKKISNITRWTAQQSVKEGEEKNSPINTKYIGEKTDASNILTITSSYPGRVSEDIKFEIKNSITNIKDDDGRNCYYYTITVYRDANSALGTSKIDEVSTQFTFDSQVALEYSKAKLLYPGQSFTDNSGLVEILLNPNATVDGRTLLASQETSEAPKYEIKNKKFSLTLLDRVPEIIDGVVSSDSFVNVTKANDEFTVSDMYSALSNSKYDETTNEPLGFYKLLDKGEYIIKFITSGAYPTFEYDDNKIAKKIAYVAAERGDCTALIDHTPNNSRTLWAKASNSVFYSINDCINTFGNNKLGESSATYAAMFTPWGVYSNSITGNITLPASFGYLNALASSTQLNGNWMAVAGVSRGTIPGLISLCQNITNAIADSYQPRDQVAINPITNVKPYGLTIWGNRTLKDNTKAGGGLTAGSFLNIRQLTNDVKRTLWVAAKTLTYEQNSDILWINFKSKIIPILDQMVSGNGLSGYDIKKQKTTKKATVKAVVKLYAIEPVEDWDITVELADSSTTIAG